MFVESLLYCFRGAVRAFCAYTILAMTLGAVALVALLPASPIGRELDHAVRLSWWFS